MKKKHVCSLTYMYHIDFEDVYILKRKSFATLTKMLFPSF